MRRFEHSGGAAVGIDRPVHPRVAMIARNHPLIGKLRAGDRADHVPDGRVLIVHLEIHMNLHAGPHVISEGQSALPFAWRIRSAKVLEDRRSIVVAERLGWNGRQARDFVQRQPLRGGQIGPRRDAGGERVAGILEHELDGSTLHRGRRPPRAMRIHVAAIVAVVGRIGVDQNPGRALLLRDVHLHAAEVPAITAENDLAVEVDAQLFQLRKVLGAAVIRIHRFAGHVSGRRRAIESGRDARIVLERFVAVDVLRRRAGHQQLALRVVRFDLHRFGEIQPGLVGNDARLESRLFEFRRNILSRLVVLRRSRNVRLRGQSFQFLARKFGVGHSKKGLIGVRLFRRKVVVAENRRSRRRRLGAEEEQRWKNQSGNGEDGNARRHQSEFSWM